MFIVIIIALAVIIGLSCYCKVLYGQARERIEYNAEQANLNKQLQEQANSYRLEIDHLRWEIEEKEKTFKALQSSLASTIETQEAMVKKAVDVEYSRYKRQAESAYESLFQDLYDYSDELRKQIDEEKKALKALEDKQAAFIQEQQRKAEMLEQQDYYRLNLSSADESDIQLLRDMQPHFAHKEAIDKIIWEVYYKPAYDILMAHLFNKNANVCGIYKITCLSNDKAYIGQSVDIKERFRSHIKTSLSYGNSTNKLYQEMKKYKPSNFLFEILEIVPRESLNERETYWINFYKTKEFGLNKTAGGS